MHLSQPLKNTLIPLLKINILFAKIIKSVFLIDIFLYPRERSSGGYIGITLSVCPVCLFVRLSVQIRVQPNTFFCLTLAYHIWNMGVLP